jgi:hypothetical protein
MEPTKARRLEHIASDALYHVVGVMRESQPPVTNQIIFGPSPNDPGTLSVYFAYKDDAALAEAERNGHFPLITEEFRKSLLDEGYPPDAAALAHVSFVSEEEVEKHGGPWKYFR